MTNPDATTLRAFLGVELPEESRRELSASLCALAPWPGRTLAARNWHVTVAFLGTTTLGTCRAIVASLGAAPLGPPFALVTAELAASPEASQARFGWLGVTDKARRLADWHAAIKPIAATHGLKIDDQPYAPHLTLARFASPTDVRAFVDGPAPRAVVIPVTALTLFQSTPTPAGSEYTALARVGLS